MKKSILSALKTGFIFLLLCLAVACSSDNNTPVPEPTPEELIIGKWYVEKITKSDGSVHEHANDCEKGSYLKFDTDNKIYSIFFYLVGGDCKSSTGGGDYYVVDGGKKVVVTALDGVTSTMDILMLNKSTLVLKVQDTMYLKRDM